jgi:hypothetical protein
MGLDPCVVEGLTECTDGGIRILAGKQVDLLESTSIGLYTGETPHVNYHWCDTLQLVLTRLELTT